jgi:hypothetical protein
MCVFIGGNGGAESFYQLIATLLCAINGRWNNYQLAVAGVEIHRRKFNNTLTCNLRSSSSNID